MCPLEEATGRAETLEYLMHGRTAGGIQLRGATYIEGGGVVNGRKARQGRSMYAGHRRVFHVVKHAPRVRDVGM